MLNIKRWFGSLSSNSIFSNDLKLYKKWQNHLLAYYLKNIKTLDAVVLLVIPYYCNYNSKEYILDKL